MAESRSAHHTIAGYHYQFDKSILEILGAKPDTPITLEGVEDVDVDRHCIQCKYHASQRYSRSLIRKPLMAFLKHYRDTGGNKRYTLYAHFADPGSFKNIDLPELKAILGEEIAGLALNDADLNTFLEAHFHFEMGDSIDAQGESVLSTLEQALRSTRADCEQYYYNNALHQVIRLCRQPTPDERTTTRRAFIKAIDNKRMIFSRWLAQLREQGKYCKHVRDELRYADALRSSKKRFVFLAEDVVADIPSIDIANFCRTLADQHYELGKVLRDAVPLCVIIDRKQSDVRKVQRHLLEWGIRINTGYEAVSFQPKLFNEAPTINCKAAAGAKPVDKVSKASYRISVISAATYTRYRGQIHTPDTFVLAGDAPASRLAPPDGSQVFRIADVDGLPSLAHILDK